MRSLKPMDAAANLRFGANFGLMRRTKFVLFATSVPRLSIGCAITGLIATAVSITPAGLPTFVRTPIPGWRNRAKPCSIGAIDRHCAADRHVLLDHERRFLLTRRVGHLATADSRAIPHVLPVCFTISQGTLYITIDEKPKRVAGPGLKRVRNIERNPMVAVVVDRYDEDWARLGWVMLRGRAEILRTGTEHDRAQELLRSRYRQLAAMQIAERPVIAVRLERVTSWGNLSVSADETGYDGQA
ncbi:MAG: TIGR03668 family PPOX class F420-dependent oxidoreductase [Bradyrhizobium sp.]